MKHFLPYGFRIFFINSKYKGDNSVYEYSKIEQVCNEGYVNMMNIVYIVAYFIVLPTRNNQSLLGVGWGRPSSGGGGGGGGGGARRWHRKDCFPHYIYYAQLKVKCTGNGQCLPRPPIGTPLGTA